MLDQSTEHPQQYPDLPHWQVFDIMRAVAWRSYKLGRSTDPVKARSLATRLSHEVIDILRNKGIDVGLHGFYRDRSDIGLYLANHQAFGLEAFLANSFIAPDTRIVLKDELLRVPITGKAMSVVDPIVFTRPPKDATTQEERRIKTSSLRYIINEQKSTLEQGGSVLVFPEGTRQRKSSEILPMESGLFKGAYSLMSDRNSGVTKRKVAIITSDTFRTLPFTPEQWKKYGTGTKHPLQFWFDTLDIDSEEPIDNFAQRVQGMMEGRLRSSGAIE